MGGRQIFSFPQIFWDFDYQSTACMLLDFAYTYPLAFTNTHPFNYIAFLPDELDLQSKQRKNTEKIR